MKNIALFMIVALFALLLSSSAAATGQRALYKLNVNDTPELYRDAVKAAIVELQKTKERPEDFYVQFPEKFPNEPVVILNLWHKSAFEKKNLGMNGNPGGKCRDMHYDKNLNKIANVLFWQ